MFSIYIRLIMNNKNLTNKVTFSIVYLVERKIRRRTMKRILSIIIVVTMSLIFLAACEGLMASAEENYIAVDFEEAGVQFVTDDTDEILSFSASNLQGEELLIEEEYVGEDVYDAIENVTENAIELGYIDVDADEDNPNAVLVTVYQYRNKTNSRYRAQVKEKVEATITNKGAWALVSDAEDIDELNSLGQEDGIPAAKVRMMIALQKMNQELPYETIKDLTPQELAELVKEKCPLAAEIDRIESEISVLQDELAGISEEDERYAQILTEIDNLESELQSYQDAYDSVVNAREQKRIQNQERVQSHMSEVDEKANAIRQRRQQNETFSEDVVDANRSRWRNIVE